MVLKERVFRVHGRIFYSEIEKDLWWDLHGGEEDESCNF